jgi:hypothetical protein
MVDLYDYQGIAVNDVQVVYVAGLSCALLVLPTGCDRAVG